MASRPFEISCPRCEAPIRPALTDGGPETDSTTLRGRSVTCGACEAEFEVLFYPR